MNYHKTGLLTCSMLLLLEITLTTREKQLYGQLWAAADTDQSGFITGADAVPFFAKSGLSPQILGQVKITYADAYSSGVLL